MSVSESAVRGAVTLPAACPLDCPDSCSLEVTVEDGRLVSVDGGHANPITDGFICAKVRNIADHVYSRERILHPGVRTGPKGEGEFERVSWDGALDRIARKMLAVRAARGGEAILPYYYGGSNGFLTQTSTDARLFRRLGASRLARTLCAAPTGAAALAMYGKMAGVALQDYVHSKLIVIWGNNPSATGIHLVPIIQRAQKAGAKLVVIDPIRTPLAARADLHLAVRPGSDLPIALSIIRWLFESGAADGAFLAAHATGAGELRERAASWTFERAATAAGVAPRDVERFARLYAETSPAVIRCGWGQERNRNGGSASAAILALPAVAGKFRVRGGGYTMSNSGVWKFGALAEEPEPETRVINMVLLGETLLTRDDPPVDLLFVYNCNPVATVPNQTKVREGLAREDLFTVVFDQVMTESALYADVVLPATTFLEHRELVRGYGAMVTHDSRPVIAPVGEARPNYDVFAELCRRTGVAREGEPESADALRDAILYGSGRGEEFRRTLVGSGVAYPEGGAAPIQFVDVFPPTADGKAQLFSPGLDDEAAHGLYHFEPDPATSAAPLALVSPSTEKTISSTFGQLNRKIVPIELNPADAAARGIADGDRVRAFNAQGEVVTRARLNPNLREGVAALPKGLWGHNTENGATSNALAPDSLTDIGGGACFNDARVEVEKL